MSLFEIKVEDASELNRVLIELQGRAQSIDQALPAIAQMLVSAVSDVVELQGPGWPALAQATLDKRRKRGRGALMLRDTGIMVEHSLAGGHGPDYAEAYFGVPYAKYHINGWGVPKRNPLDLTPVEDGLLEDVTELLLASFV